MTNSLNFLSFTNELLRNSLLNFFFSTIVLACSVLMIVYIKWKWCSHFSLQWASFIVQKSDHLKVSFLYRSNLLSALLLWTVATRDVSCYFCHAPTPSCTVRNYWHLSSCFANFLMAPIIVSRKWTNLINDHKFSTIFNMSAIQMNWNQSKKRYPTSFLWIKSLLHFESTLSVMVPLFDSVRLTQFCP